jgi:hypothetical protein
MRKMIDMAEEAGMTGLEDGGLFDNFLAFEALVRADEREACAKVCEEDAFVEQWKGLAEAAKRIRAKGNT